MLVTVTMAIMIVAMIIVIVVVMVSVRLPEMDGMITKVIMIVLKIVITKDNAGGDDRESDRDSVRAWDCGCGNDVDSDRAVAIAVIVVVGVV